jgi:hypothetical protein
VSEGDELAREVFVLAYHLHWSHAEVYALPVPERRRYIELLEQQLKYEQDAVNDRHR